MKYRFPIFTLLVITSASSCLYAQTTDGPPVNAQAVLATLNQIKHKQETDIKSTETALAQQLMTTASSPSDAINYYIDAVYNTQFNGQDHEAKELQDWKKRHEPDFKDANFKDALCLHLMYLSLTLSHDAGVKTKDLLPSLVDYTQKVQANETGLAGQEELMETPLGKSIFVRSLGIGQYVTDDSSWELTPIKVDDIFSKVILPEYRVEKNAEAIFQYWDARIQREEAVVDSLKRPLEIDKFAKVTKPGLLWKRAEEYVALGMKNTAITTMLSIIQDSPYHPDAPGWIDEVEKLVKTTAAPQPQPPATSPVVANPGTAAQPAQN